VIATAFTRDVDDVRTLRADHVIDVQTARFEERAKDVDIVIDTIGGKTLDRSFAVLKPGGVLVSSVAMPDQDKAARHRVRGVFFLVTVTSEGLTKIAELLDAGHLTTHVGEVLPLAEARLAHELLAGKPPQAGQDRLGGRCMTVASNGHDPRARYCAFRLACGLPAMPLVAYTLDNQTSRALAGSFGRVTVFVYEASCWRKVKFSNQEGGPQCQELPHREPFLLNSSRP
jgi:hypothetical protein